MRRSSPVRELVEPADAAGGERRGRDLGTEQLVRHRALGGGERPHAGEHER
jgi:hypothetical protein